jgi:sterol desaturase/sphingolipid hydroxylase (fatty acid hydroxylase superfamily)
METYGKILLIAMPIFLILVLLEKWYGWKKGQDTVRVMDMISSLTSGVTNVTKDVLGLSVAILSYGWLLKNLAVTTIENNISVYIIAFIALDFSGYWIHRIQHTVNVFWNAHLVHHSSEDFNLACALRQSISVFFKLFTFFLIPAAILGVPVEVIAIVAPLHLFIQFWYHTQHIKRMGMLEHVIVTPSHHRVHHAINPTYLDKNYSQVFIVWDKLFGTFQEEKDDVPPVYGITRPVQTWNPIKINFQHLFLLIKDAWRTNNWVDKFRIWFMPTGWRPSDVMEKYPVRKIDDVYHFEKYDPTSSRSLQAWAFTQLMFLLFFICVFFSNLALIGSPGIFYYGAFIFTFIYALTELMDRNPRAYVWETLKFIFALFCLYQSDWLLNDFNLTTYWKIIVIAYLVISMTVTIYISFINNLEDRRKIAVSSSI